MSQSATRYGGWSPAGGRRGPRGRRTHGRGTFSESSPKEAAEPRRSYRTKVAGSMVQAGPPRAFPHRQAGNAVQRPAAGARECPRRSMRQRRGPTVLTSLSPCLFTLLSPLSLRSNGDSCALGQECVSPPGAHTHTREGGPCLGHAERPISVGDIRMDASSCPTSAPSGRSQFDDVRNLLQTSGRDVI